ncbi:DUF1080 domain-containing protein [Pseudopedobacter sp.]|uniref:DUF1080 domain-containing protein n=1 Tax=Pseudopedobacter sp. TaxID=1936787 RepID=UPI00333E5312
MNKLLYTLFAILVLQLSVSAQQDDQRTTITKIADLLPQPSANEQKLNEVMKQLDIFQATDITVFLSQLMPPGKGDNSRIEYATNSYAFYVLQAGKENQRVKFVQGLIGALKEIKDRDNKGYIISLLQKAGKDDAVSALIPYLKDEYLAEKAARALATIGSEAASKALLNELAGAKGKALVSIIEALGDTRYAGAESALLPLLNKENVNVQKVLLYTLSNIAGATSYGALKSAAQKANYVYDVTNASSSYIHYAKRLVENGDNKLAEKIAQDLLKDATNDMQVNTRISALTILTKIHGSGYTRNLIKAAGNNNRKYRIAALKLALPFQNKGNINQWIKGLKRADPETKAYMFALLSTNPDNTKIISELKKSLLSSSAVERSAAIVALSKLSGDESAPVLIDLLAKGNELDRPVIKEALLTMKGQKLTSMLTQALPKANSASKVVMIEVLDNRAYAGSFAAVQLLLNDSDASVRRAAYNALAQVARSKDLSVLISLLNNNRSEERKAVEQAIMNVVNYSSDKDREVNSVLNYYQGLNEDQKINSVDILSGIGGEKALQVVAQSIHSNNINLKNAAVLAIANWKDESALQNLITLSRTTQDVKQFDAILRGLIRITSAANITDERKVLIYRDAMEVALTVSQRTLILKKIEENKTYNALIFAGTFLDDKDLQKTAAVTVMNIALDNINYNGNEVKKLLIKVLGLLGGSESNYLKEAVRKHLAEMPRGMGYVSLFNGKDLSGWKGLVANPLKRNAMGEEELALAQKKADEEMNQGWLVKDGVLFFNGKGNNIATIKQYGDFELWVDWKLDKNGKDGDAGIYLRGTPQVQIWDLSRTKVGAQVGSGGLYNNKKNPGIPLKVADNPLGEWNTFKIKMTGEKVTVYLNGDLVVDNVTLENYWDKNQSIFPVEQIELQAHGTTVYYRDIFIKEVPRKEIFKLSAQEQKEGFKVLFDGTNLDSWTGNTTSYVISDEGTLAIYPVKGSGGNLYTKEEFGDFIYRFNFRLTPGANNGIGIRSPLTGNAAYEGMEIQVLDNDADKYKTLHLYQYHGSVYGIIPAKRGYLKPVGEWNEEEIYIKGKDIKVTLNGTVILEGNLDDATKNGTLDKKDHPGLNKLKGHIGFLGHGSEVHFKNIRIKELNK